MHTHRIVANEAKPIERPGPDDRPPRRLMLRALARHGHPSASSALSVSKLGSRRWHIRISGPGEREQAGNLSVAPGRRLALHHVCGPTPGYPIRRRPRRRLDPQPRRLPGPGHNRRCPAHRPLAGQRPRRTARGDRRARVFRTRVGPGAGMAGGGNPRRRNGGAGTGRSLRAGHRTHGRKARCAMNAFFVAVGRNGRPCSPIPAAFPAIPTRTAAPGFRFHHL